ncbi:phage tail assembly chaperone [Metaclostridioides mangenotii]|uniref:XkdN-like protein n=1 Tax=Metaclostridioides mangenotii TaxID=1540 RepID=A0ABS4EBU9_9FIRM|nr:phage portal protein [Clostridioides mangenotii]MBP1855410.1 hypothetical protein [Clostridioides mangenotii]
MDLTTFLSQNAIKLEGVKYAPSIRYKDKDGKPIEWELKAIDSGQDSAIRKSCTKELPVPGKKGQFRPTVDQERYQAELCIACVADPNFHDKELQDSVGVMGAVEALNKILLPGEYVDLLMEVNKLLGYDVSFEEKVEQAKN